MISIHSYTPQLKGRPPRRWEVGILWHHDGRMALPLIERLRAEGFRVGDNEPYSGELEGDTMSRHGTGRGLAHVLIEIRQDLIATAEGQEAWAARLAPIIQGVWRGFPMDEGRGSSWRRRRSGRCAIICGRGRTCRTST